MLLIRVLLFELQCIVRCLLVSVQGVCCVSDATILPSHYLGSNKARVAARLTAAGAF